MTLFKLFVKHCAWAVNGMYTYMYYFLLAKIIFCDDNVRCCLCVDAVYKTCFNPGTLSWPVMVIFVSVAYATFWLKKKIIHIHLAFKGACFPIIPKVQHINNNIHLALCTIAALLQLINNSICAWYLKIQIHTPMKSFSVHKHPVKRLFSLGNWCFLSATSSICSSGSYHFPGMGIPHSYQAT